MQYVIPASNFCSTLHANVNNEKLTDAQFRQFVRNTLPIVEYPRLKEETVRLTWLAANSPTSTARCT